MYEKKNEIEEKFKKGEKIPVPPKSEQENRLPTPDKQKQLL
mgnify:CR=1 FL=1